MKYTGKYLGAKRLLTRDSPTNQWKSQIW